MLGTGRESGRSGAVAGRGRARRQPVSPLPPAPRPPRSSGASVFSAGLSPPPPNPHPHPRRPGSAARAKALSCSRSSSAGCPRFPAPLPAAPRRSPLEQGPPGGRGLSGKPEPRPRRSGGVLAGEQRGARSRSGRAALSLPGPILRPPARFGRSAAQLYPGALRAKVRRDVFTGGGGSKFVCACTRARACVCAYARARVWERERERAWRGVCGEARHRAKMGFPSLWAL